ncbi:Hint domain-containing protein [Candidatus Rhodobacter oscarellae]|uniref:Hint domain-containing protein n=1 Tax=Candidatus Rhodobacter oscarellae TaxID=1675527 RepID=UPI000670ABE7|nr:Hint domain-containing protein [Candidatus Rhodobacter lobularis]
MPYFDPNEGFASLAGTAVTQPITNAGDNAVVVNLCFAAGTMIATPEGEAAVETLAIGDRVRTADGRDVAVKWLGVQTHRAAAVNLPLPESAQPVRIRAGALGGGLPHSDLTVTATHGMVLDGMVINASALVNGDTIDFVPLSELEDSITVYHIKTENHDVILANGAPAETFLDAAGRAAFDNYQEYLDLYGAERIIPEMRMPRISTARLVPQAIKDRLAPGDTGAATHITDRPLRRTA